ncbi:hypothetical protein Mosig_00014 [Pelagibacter phage Mosig EXVC030M]|nr:hypothetical protein Mosig_00014 [Pelagibacter phage Mosig EXVC030M]
MGVRPTPAQKNSDVARVNLNSGLFQHLRLVSHHFKSTN